MKQLTLAVLVTIGCAVSSHAADWPQFRGPDRDGKSPETKVPLIWSAGKNIKWKVELPSGGNSSPIVSAGKVFLAVAEDPKGTKRSLYCFDRHDGRKLWTATVDWQKTESAHSANPYCGSSPAADGEHVIVWHGSAGVYCYDYKGTILWKRDLGEFKQIWGYGSSPVISGDLVFLNCGPGARSFVTALNKNTGKTLWETPEPGGADDRSPQTGSWVGSWATPIVVTLDGRQQVIVPQPGHVNGYDPANGRIVWTCGGTGDLAYCDTMLGNGETAGIGIAMAGYGGKAIGFRLGNTGDTTATNRLWQSTDKPPQRISTGIVIGRHLFMANEPGFACFEVATGKELWKHRPPGQTFWAAMSATPDRLYVTSQSGLTYVFAPDPKAFKLLATNELGEGSNSAIAISDGHLFLRTFGHLHCIEEE